MTIDEALKRWGYRSRNKERLIEVCRSCPKRFTKKGQINIPKKAGPLYIPSKCFRTQGATYAHLLKACIERKEVVPESLGKTHDEVKAYLHQLDLCGMITRYNNSKATTLCYIPTPQGEEWITWRNKVKRLFQMIQPLIPTVTINT